MSSVFFTSDWHVGHDYVAGLRGFESAAVHDQALGDNYRDLVHKSATVWFLGDMSAGNPAKALDLVQSLPGAKHLILGNHDRAHPMHRNSHLHQARFLEVFASVQTMARRRISDQEVLLSHFPYDGPPGEADRDEVRYGQYRLPDQGRWLLHGHTHLAYQRVHDRQIHVGVDAWGMAPVSLESVAGCMKSANL